MMSEHLAIELLECLEGGLLPGAVSGHAHTNAEGDKEEDPHHKRDPQKALYRHHTS